MRVMGRRKVRGLGAGGSEDTRYPLLLRGEGMLGWSSPGEEVLPVIVTAPLEVYGPRQRARVVERITFPINFLLVFGGIEIATDCGWERSPGTRADPSAGASAPCARAGHSIPSVAIREHSVSLVTLIDSLAHTYLLAKYREKVGAYFR